MSEALSIFNIGQRQEEMNQSMFQQKGESNLFDPKLKDVNDTKVLIIRPVPYVFDVKNSLVRKQFYALDDGAGLFYFDSRSTFNRPAENHWEFCPVGDLWMKFNNSKDLNIKNRANWMHRQTACYAYVQIVAFPGQEAMNGQIVVMRLPIELVKLFDKMANPPEAELKLGTKPVNCFDMFGGSNIKCTITGKNVNGTLMRDWSVVQENKNVELTLPLGPNGAMQKVSTLEQQAVVDYLQKVQTINMLEQFGYHEPSIEAKIRVKKLLQAWVNDIPALQPVVAQYLPEVDQHLKQHQEAQPAPQAIPTGGAPANGAVSTQQPAPQPGIQPAQQPAAQPVPQPTPQTISAGDPMAAPAPQPAPAAPQPAAPAPGEVNLP